MSSLANAVGVPSQVGTITPDILYNKMFKTYLYQNTVLGNITNTDYQGDIKQFGNSVSVSDLPDIVVNNYVNGQQLDIQALSYVSKILTIDKGLYYAFKVTDVDKKQANFAFSPKVAEHAAKILKIALERNFFANIYSEADSHNKGSAAGIESGDIDLGVTGTPYQVTSSTVLDLIENASVCLDEQNVPDNDRYIVLPPWAIRAIKTSELKQAYLTGDAKSPLRTGLVGMIDRFTVYSSNLLPKVVDGSATCWHAIAGQKLAVSFAPQLTQTETGIKNPNAFEEITRGLMVYGFKAFEPKALCDLYIKK